MSSDLIEAQRKLAGLATGCRPPFDPDRILDERFEAIRDEVTYRKPKSGIVYNDDGSLTWAGTVYIHECAPDEGVTYLTMTPSRDYGPGLGLPHGGGL